jgi:hypothetical protein
MVLVMATRTGVLRNTEDPQRIERDGEHYQQQDMWS